MLFVRFTDTRPCAMPTARVNATIFASQHKIVDIVLRERHTSDRYWLGLSRKNVKEFSFILPNIRIPKLTSSLTCRLIPKSLVVLITCPNSRSTVYRLTILIWHYGRFACQPCPSNTPDAENLKQTKVLCFCPVCGVSFNSYRVRTCVQRTTLNWRSLLYAIIPQHNLPRISSAQN